jgi:hypothetical protein
MTCNFADAHQRHLKDANILYTQNRLANSDHLYGLSAECGLKALMVKFGMSITDGKPTNIKDRVHAKKVWDRYETYRQGHALGTQYPLPSSNPFLDWDVSQRYTDQQYFTTRIVTPHKQGADCVTNLIKQATLAGLLP